MVRPKIKQLRVTLFVFGLLLFQRTEAHPMPNSVVNLYVTEQGVSGEAKMPYIDFALAFGKPKEEIKLNSAELRRYFLDHIKIKTGAGTWQTSIQSIRVTSSTDPIVGKYEELWVTFSCKPPANTQTRYFTLLYDAIIHQVITHKILVNVLQDWQGGILGTQMQVGEIALDIPKGRYDPLQIRLEKGNWWKGFGSMVALGMYHIAEGTDHLLFLLVLLLPCMLVARGKHWGEFGGRSYGLKNIIKVVTAFTLGHSITLFVGAFQWLRLPQQWVEVWIALSILISAVHAYRPIFAKKEIWVAVGFGFVHGLAFASILMDMHLSTQLLAWSILGFNIGIECMQMLLLALVLPAVFWLSKRPAYVLFRKFGAIFSFIMASYWLVERIFFF